MLDHILEELRYMRKRLDDHIDDEDGKHGGYMKAFTSMEREMGKLREEIGTNRGKIVGIVSFVSAVIAGLISWFVSHMRGTT